jgi:hypothetical protein
MAWKWAGKLRCKLACHEEASVPTEQPSRVPSQQGNDAPLFRDVETSSEEISGRARSIALWLGVLTCAIFFSQFGRPSRAHEKEFLRGAAKVEALGKPAANAPRANLLLAGGDAAAHETEAKEVPPAVYVSKKYGVTWQYPRTYVLRKGANANLNLSGQPAAASAFDGAGGVTLGTVNIPSRVYPGNNFRSGSLTVRVNPQISQDACGQIKISAADGGEDTAFPSSRVTVGTIDFVEAGDEVEDGSAAAGTITQEKFYHVYDNDACYEFAMSVSMAGSAEKGADSADQRDDVFERLNEILTSVTIVPRNTSAAVKNSW